MPRAKPPTIYTATSALNALAELESDRAKLERREREMRDQAAKELGSLVLSIGLGWDELGELKTLLERVKLVGMAESLVRLVSPTATVPDRFQGDVVPQLAALANGEAHREVVHAAS